MRERDAVFIKQTDKIFNNLDTNHLYHNLLLIKSDKGDVYREKHFLKNMSLLTKLHTHNLGRK
jgi:hypothetical protein